MNIHIMTLFPEMVMGGLNTSITGRAISKGILSIEAVNIRDYAFNKHNSVDDYPYGGGAGMLMQAEPVYQCYQAIIDKIHTQGGADSELCVEKRSPGCCTCHHRVRHLRRGWRKSLHRKRN